MFQYNLLTCFQSNGVPVNGLTYIFADAWVFPGVICQIIYNYVRRGFCMERRQQNEKLKTVFNSEEKQNQFFNPFNIYKNKEHANSEMILGVWT